MLSSDFGYHLPPELIAQQLRQDAQVQSLVHVREPRHCYLISLHSDWQRSLEFDLPKREVGAHLRNPRRREDELLQELVIGRDARRRHAQQDIGIAGGEETLHDLGAGADRVGELTPLGRCSNVLPCH